MKQAYMKEDALCTHERTPEGLAELRTGEGLRGDIVSCWMQSLYCVPCKKSFWVRVEEKQ